jgi:hypothetical protein
VDDEPAIVPYLSLFENLTFGVSNPNVQRVKKVFSTLCTDRLGKDNWLGKELESCITGLGSKMRKTLSTSDEGSPLMQNKEPSEPSFETAAPAAPQEEGSDDGSPPPWHLRLSQSERKMVHLCRAFMYNPEILVLNKPLDDGDMDESMKFLEMLREFVDNRGVEMPPSLLSARRPRSAFFSGGMDASADEAKEISDLQLLMQDTAGSFRVINGGKGKFPQFPAFSKDELEEKRMLRQRTFLERKGHGDGMVKDSTQSHGSDNGSMWSNLISPGRGQDAPKDGRSRCCY